MRTAFLEIVKTKRERAAKSVSARNDHFFSRSIATEKICRSTIDLTASALSRHLSSLFIAARVTNWKVFVSDLSSERDGNRMLLAKFKTTFLFLLFSVSVLCTTPRFKLCFKKKTFNFAKRFHSCSLRRHNKLCHLCGVSHSPFINGLPKKHTLEMWRLIWIHRHVSLSQKKKSNLCNVV